MAYWDPFWGASSFHAIATAISHEPLERLSFSETFYVTAHGSSGVSRLTANLLEIAVRSADVATNDRQPDHAY